MISTYKDTNNISLPQLLSIISYTELTLNIYDLPWHSIKSSDASMHHYMEAVNNTNAEYPHLCVVVCAPDENEMRNIYTLSRNILPDYQPYEYLDNLMCTMLNCKNTLVENLKRERPWLNSKRNTIGFNASHDKEDADKSVKTGFVAAQEDIKLD